MLALANDGYIICNIKACKGTYTRSHHWIMTFIGHSGARVKHSEALKGNGLHKCSSAFVIPEWQVSPFLSSNRKYIFKKENRKTLKYI